MLHNRCLEERDNRRRLPVSVLARKVCLHEMANECCHCQLHFLTLMVLLKNIVLDILVTSRVLSGLCESRIASVHVQLTVSNRPLDRICDTDLEMLGCHILELCAISLVLYLLGHSEDSHFCCGKSEFDLLPSIKNNLLK